MQTIVKGFLFFQQGSFRIMKVFILFFTIVFFLQNVQAADNKFKRMDKANNMKKENITVGFTNMISNEKIKTLNNELSEYKKISNHVSDKEKPATKRKKYKGLSQNIYRNNAGSVVYIGNPSAKGTGSGFLINKEEGLILTNWHVIDGAKKVYVWFKPEDPNKMDEDLLINEPRIDGTVIKKNKSKDLGLIKVLRVPKNAKALVINKKIYVDVGSTAYSIGHPSGLTWTFNSGMVTQVRKGFKWRYKNSRHLANVIQHEVPTNPGNSGGPLFNERGHVIGVNSFKDSKGEVINFSVSTDEIDKFLKEKIVEKKKSQYIQKKSKQTWIQKKSKKKNSLTDGIKKNFPDAKPHDENKNGIYDTWWIDENKNGIIDTAFVDDNEDGLIEAVLVDDDENGKWDFLFVDKDLDGNPDIAYIDRDQDGNHDVVAYDYDQDGEWDKFENAG